MFKEYRLTKYFFPLKAPLKISEGVYFDNLRDPVEIRQISKLLRQLNNDYSKLPPKTSMFGEEYLSIESVLHDYLEGIEDNVYFDSSGLDKYKDIFNRMASCVVAIIFEKNESGKKSLYEKETYGFEFEYLQKICSVSSFLVNPKISKYTRSIFLPEIQNPFGGNNSRDNEGEYIFNLLITAGSKRKQKNVDFDFTYFSVFYDKSILILKKIIEDREDKKIIYIIDVLELSFKVDDDKVRLMLVISLLELLVAHKPNPTYYNIEDSIKLQFSNKIATLLYISKKKLNIDNIGKELKLIYDLRSDVTHGNYEEIPKTRNRLHQHYLSADESYRVKFENAKKEAIIFDKLEFTDSWVMDTVFCNIHRYIRILLLEYFKDRELFDIIRN